MLLPRVSVVMATWNRANFIDRAIESVVGQTFVDWELIIVDDGSTDATRETVGRWVERDGRIKYLPIEHTGKIARVSNEGLRVAAGEFIAILDDDDWWIDPSKLAKQVAFLDAHRDYVACGGWFVVVDQDGNRVSRVGKPASDAAIRRVALFANPIANSTAVFRRTVGLYDESLSQFADWDFWLKAGVVGKLCNLPEYFLAYRMWGGGSSFVNQRANARAAEVIIWRYRAKYAGFVRAFISMLLYRCYAYLPVCMRSVLNAPLSRFKKYVGFRVSG